MTRLRSILPMVIVLVGAISRIAPASADSGWELIQEAREKYNYCSTASDCVSVGACFCNGYEVPVNKREAEKVQAMFVNFCESGLQEGLCDAAGVDPKTLMLVCREQKCTRIHPSKATLIEKSVLFFSSYKLFIGLILFPFLLIGLVIFYRKKLFKPTPPA